MVGIYTFEPNPQNSTIMKKALFLASICFLCSCVKPHVEIVVGPEADYSEQPTIPMYSQLLLKGPVKCVTDKVDSRDGEFTHMLIFRFDSSRNLIYYEKDNSEMGCTKETSYPYFYSWWAGYAYFCFPETWTKTNSAIDVAPESEGRFPRRIEYTWREDGVFTDIRFYSNDTLCTIERVVNLAEKLYDSNGFPILSFSFDGNQPCVLCRNTFSNIDKFGNPLKIYIATPNGNVLIDRIIEYYSE